MSDGSGLVPPGPPAEPQPGSGDRPAAPLPAYVAPPAPSYPFQTAKPVGGDKPLGWTGLGLTLAFCVPLLPLAGAVVSIVALVRNRFRPRWVPALSLVLGLAFTAAQVAVVATWDPSENSRDESISPDALAVGDCFNDPVLRGLEEDEQGQALGELHHLDCSEPHDFEVYGVYDLKGKKFPGDKAIIKKTRRCLPLFRKFVGMPYRKSKFAIYNYYPSSDTWTMGDRTVTCIIAHPKLKPLKGSLKDARR